MKTINHRVNYEQTMKSMLWTVAVCLAAFFNPVHAQDNAAKDQWNKVINAYYQLKDALVKDDSKTAAASADSFIKNLNGVSYKVISEDNVNTLLSDAGGIVKAKNIEKQRTYFANLSMNMADLAKALKLTDNAIFIQYCPMKKSYWLSSEKLIRNPYYGSAMLSCGNVSETIE